MGLFQDYMRGVVMKNNPALLKKRLDSMDAQSVQSAIGALYGEAPVAEQRQMQMQQEEGPMQPGMQPGQGLINQQTVAPQAGTNMYDESKPLWERQMTFNKGLGTSGLAPLVDQWKSNQRAMQGSNMQGMNAMARQIQEQKNPDYNKAFFPDGTPNLPYQKYAQKTARAGANKTGKTEQAMTTADLKQWQIPDGNGGYTDAPPGMSMMDIGRAGGKLKPTVKNAGQTAMIAGAQKELPRLKELLYKGGKGGKVNRDTLWGSTLQTLDPTGGYIAKQLPWSTAESQEMSSIYERGIQGITRTETGAAMPSEEIGNTRQRFQATSSDDEAAIKSKMAAYEYFINNAADLMNPQGVKVTTEEQRTAMVNEAITKSFEATTEAYDQTDGPKPGVKWK